MELAFDSRPLRSFCEDQSIAAKELSPAVAETLKHRLADLHAARSVNDLLVGRPRVSVVAGVECFMIDLCEGYLIVLQANHPRNPTTEDGGLNWAMVSRLKVIRIGRDDD